MSEHYKACVACGFGDELQSLEVQRDADNEGWWIHPLCREYFRCNEAEMGS
jgi:hypothetical protein